MKNYLKTLTQSSSLERLKNHLGIQYRLKREVPKNPKIAMAILSYERPDYLEVSLDSLFHTNIYDYDITFFISDDGSKDKRVKDIINTKRDKKYKIVRWFFDKGPNNTGAVINRAMRKVLEYDDFDIIGWADPDCLYHPEWLKTTMDICLWAKKNHKDHTLGPFTSFNSSDYIYHRILGIYDSPFGKYLVKRQAGMLNYFYFKDDFLKLGYFDEDIDDETKMTNRLDRLKIRNFCPEISFVDHIGHYSVLNKWRPQRYDKAMFALKPYPDNWYIDYRKYRRYEKEHYEKIEQGYEDKLKELDKLKETSIIKRILKSIINP